MDTSTLVKPYGDRLDDGKVQLSFTLPVPSGPEAREAAIETARNMGLDSIQVSSMQAMDKSFTFFVVFGSLQKGVDFSAIRVPKLENPILSFDGVNEFIKDNIGRKLVVVGACIGSDAHTVGIDALFNMKGYAHDWGFERYPMLSAFNLRAQVAVEDLAQKVVQLRADAVLVSRVVTQRDAHIVELKKFLEVLKTTEGVMPNLIKICGGPRIGHKEALEWGYDAGFGPGTKPSEVASYIAHESLKRKHLMPIVVEPVIIDVPLVEELPPIVSAPAVPQEPAVPETPAVPDESPVPEVKDETQS